MRQIRPTPATGPVGQTWSTSVAGRDGQFGYWRELICAAFLALTPESDLRDGFAGTVTQRPLGPLSLAQIDSRRQRVAAPNGTSPARRAPATTPTCSYAASA